MLKWHSDATCPLLDPPCPPLPDEPPCWLPPGDPLALLPPCPAPLLPPEGGGPPCDWPVLLPPEGGGPPGDPPPLLPPEGGGPPCVLPPLLPPTEESPLSGPNAKWSCSAVPQILLSSGFPCQRRCSEDITPLPLIKEGQRGPRDLYATGTLIYAGTQLAFEGMISQRSMDEQPGIEEESCLQQEQLVLQVWQLLLGWSQRAVQACPQSMLLRLALLL